jgi:hypothetical protein
MPLQKDHIRFDDEIERLEQEREELAEQLAPLDDDNPAAQRLAQRGEDIDVNLKGLRWARDDAHKSDDDSDGVPVWDEPVDGVTLAGLTGGEYGQVEDELEGETGTGSGATRVYFVAKGTVDAPYVDPSAEYRQQVGAVSQLPIAFLKWAESKINDLSSVGEAEGNSFAALVQEKQAALSDDE